METGSLIAFSLEDCGEALGTREEDKREVAIKNGKNSARHA